jgi:hypothetical protein
LRGKKVFLIVAFSPAAASKAACTFVIDILIVSSRAMSVDKAFV